MAIWSQAENQANTVERKKRDGKERLSHQDIIRVLESKIEARTIVWAFQLHGPITPPPFFWPKLIWVRFQYGSARKVQTLHNSVYLCHKFTVKVKLYNPRRKSFFF